MTTKQHETLYLSRCLCYNLVQVTEHILQSVDVLAIDVLAIDDIDLQ